MGDRCPTCAGNGCEYRCGLRGGCEYAYAGPDSHRICHTCHGMGRTFPEPVEDPDA